VAVGLDKGELLEYWAGDRGGRLLFAVIRWKPRTRGGCIWDGGGTRWRCSCFHQPVVRRPLFNKFVPLQQKHPELVESIGKLTQRAGVPIPAERMFPDGSEREDVH